MLQSKIAKYKTRLYTVRFGNVMASRGGVIPLFQKQIAASGPVTLTHPEMQRFFMTIPEAVQLVVQVGAFDKESGGIYVLDMGDPIRIADLAYDLIELFGLRPNHDIQIVTVGLRAGEKLSEQLLEDGEYLAPTRVKGIFMAKNGPYVDAMQFERNLDSLREATEHNNDLQIRRLLQEFGIGFRIPVR